MLVHTHICICTHAILVYVTTLVLIVLTFMLYLCMLLCVCVCVSELLHIRQYSPSMFLPMLACVFQLYACILARLLTIIDKYVYKCTYLGHITTLPLVKLFDQ